MTAQTKQTTTKQTMTATQARAHFFELLDAAQYKNTETLIEKNGAVVAKIVPIKEKPFNWKAYIKELQAIGPFITDQDIEDMKEARESFNKPRFSDW